MRKLMEKYLRVSLTPENKQVVEVLSRHVGS